MVNNPKVFISYSHDNQEHKDWVRQLATKLMDKGIETILDQWDLDIGANLPKFMENGLQECDRVLVICTDAYLDKSSNGTGGVGYENTIVTANLLLNQETKKFIPIVKGVTKTMKTPLGLAGRVYIDFTKSDEFNEAFNQLVHEIYGRKIQEKPQLGTNPFQKTHSKPSFDEQSTVFFAQRFSHAFPGTREIEWFEGDIAAKRLEILLKEPIDFSNANPIWWWGFGDLHISKFDIIDGNYALMDEYELKIKKIAAVHSSAYYASFVYVEMEGMEPTGLYSTENTEKWRQQLGYCAEEYANFRGTKISRADYDDGATVIDDLPVQLNGEADLKIRFITPRNFIIAPNGSPINNNSFDSTRDELLRLIMMDENKIEQLKEAVRQLPKQREY